MHDNSHEYTVMTLHKIRQQELLDKAEHYRLANMKRELTRRLRRGIRINND